MSILKMLEESINDAGKFKAVFIIGLPGAGKSYTASKLSGAVQPRIVNTDTSAEFLQRKLSTPINRDTWDILFADRSQKMTKARLYHHLNGMLPLFIDGTSNNVSNILHRFGILESLGYDIGIISITADIEVAKKRVVARAEQIGRHVDEDFIDRVYAQQEENLSFLRPKVNYFKTVVNNGSLDDTALDTIYRKTQDFFTQKLSNPLGRRYMEQLAAEKQKYLVPTIDERTLQSKVDGWYKF